MPIKTDLERPDKILLAMRDLAALKPGFLKYEDIVVKAFEMFPDEFALRGYPHFPDSSDIHKPLYGILKKQGLVRSANKAFALTPRGMEQAEQLIRLVGGPANKKEQARSADRLTRAEELEVDRVAKSAAFSLFTSGQSERILDTDFYAFFGCTVRTSKNDFIGRVTSTTDALKHAKKLNKPDPSTATVMTELLGFMNDRFKSEFEGKAGGNA